MKKLLPRVTTVFLLLLLVFSAGCAARQMHNQPLDTAWYADAAPAAARETRGYTRTSQYLTMRDGVKIAIDVYLPAGLRPGEKIPAILNQTRYWRNIDLHWPFNKLLGTPKEIAAIVSFGYALIRVDARGSGASFGTRPYPWSENEIKDGAEIVDWIVAQPWSDGKVGAAGGSYEGTTAEFLLVNNHPAVKAAAPLFALYDVYTDVAFPGGIHLSWFTKIWEQGNRAMDLNRPQDVLWYARLATTGVLPVDDDRDGRQRAAAARAHAGNYWVHREASQLTFRDDVSPGGFCCDVFSPHAYRDKLERSGAAVYSYSGWFAGGYAHAAIKRHLTLSHPGNKLVLGPWDHGGDDHVLPFGVTVPAKFDHLAELRRFFDYNLKGIDTGIDREPSVHYYTMVENKWKAAASWPPPATPTSFYLAADRQLSALPPTDADASDAYRIDQTASAGNYARWRSLAIGMGVHYPDRARRDKTLLVYETAPLAADTEVTGHPLVTLFYATDKADGQVFVFLEDVDERGRVGYVTEGQLRAIHRKLSDEPPPYNSPTPYRTFKRADAQPLIPGEPADLTFDLHPTSYLFKKGHRIRLAIAGADEHFRPLPDPPEAFLLHRDAQRPSRLVLPIVSR